MNLGVVGSIIVCAAEMAADPPRRPVQLLAEPPEIPLQSESDWVNSKPLKFADLKGKVVVVNFWTFG